HACDFFNLFLLAWVGIQDRAAPVEAWGPGPAGGLRALPPHPLGHDEPPAACGSNPTPGLLEMTEAQIQAHAYDINVRIREAGRTDLRGLFATHEIAIPQDIGGRPPNDVSPPMEPIVITEDDAVRVSAVLVHHPPVFPAFAYRFDTDDGAVVVSGDTAPSPNLVRLAEGADILVHEVLDADFMTAQSGTSWRSQAMLNHLLCAHTPLEKVGSVAGQAGVRRLVLSHFIPSIEGIPDERWAKGAAAGFDGEVVVGHDLMELHL
ncbi:MAG TPA: MBL fold metallo-hydrolase, partial [bacterium]|nr:MBL fold metallo-hydrolase [bacterium]